jgi:hypothetical protein
MPTEFLEQVRTNVLYLILVNNLLSHLLFFCNEVRVFSIIRIRDFLESQNILSILNIYKSFRQVQNKIFLKLHTYLLI